MPRPRPSARPAPPAPRPATSSQANLRLPSLPRLLSPTLPLGSGEGEGVGVEATSGMSWAADAGSAVGPIRRTGTRARARRTRHQSWPGTQVAKASGSNWVADSCLLSYCFDSDWLKSGYWDPSRQLFGPAAVESFTVSAHWPRSSAARCARSVPPPLKTGAARTRKHSKSCTGQPVPPHCTGSLHTLGSGQADSSDSSQQDEPSPRALCGARCDDKVGVLARLGWPIANRIREGNAKFGV